MRVRRGSSRTIPTSTRSSWHRRDGRCIVYADGAPLYFDTQHLTINGAAYLMPLFEGLF